jgi:hypothetical protein
MFGVDVQKLTIEMQDGGVDIEVTVSGKGDRVLDVYSDVRDTLGEMYGDARTVPDRDAALEQLLSLWPERRMVRGYKSGELARMCANPSTDFEQALSDFLGDSEGTVAIGCRMAAVSGKPAGGRWVSSRYDSSRGVKIWYVEEVKEATS